MNQHATPDSTVEITFDRALALLGHGTLTIEGQIPWSSNSTFYASVQDAEGSVHAVYKPQRGERPLWDFPSGTLHYREMAAFLVSEAIGWRLVPPTVLRDGPFGAGALQLFIPHDPDDHYLALQEPDQHASKRIAAFDVVINNGDRKAGHVLHAADGALWAIDHGVSFHVEPKLRTVIWDFAGQPVPADVIADLAQLADQVGDGTEGLRGALSEVLNPDEVEGFLDRTRTFVASAQFPEPQDDRWSIPWPPV